VFSCLIESKQYACSKKCIVEGKNYVKKAENEEALIRQGSVTAEKSYFDDDEKKLAKVFKIKKTLDRHGRKKTQSEVNKLSKF
jgi:hypothetical protein